MLARRDFIAIVIVSVLAYARGDVSGVLIFVRSSGGGTVLVRGRPPHHTVVGAAFDLLDAGLGPFVARLLGDVLPPEASGPELLQQKDVAAGRVPGASATDGVSLNLRAMIEPLGETGRPLSGRVSASATAYATELTEVLGRWTRNEAFTVGETFRAIDSIELLPPVHAARHGMCTEISVMRSRSAASAALKGCSVIVRHVRRRRPWTSTTCTPRRAGSSPGAPCGGRGCRDGGPSTRTAARS
jgi:hypothetical protein